MILKAEMVARILKRDRKSGTDDPLLITPLTSDIEGEAGGAASIDLRLGTWFLTFREARMPSFNVNESEDSTSKDSRQLQFTQIRYVPYAGQYFLHPKSFALGITLEWLRIPRYLAGYVIGKSSWGRRGLVIATAAGVHPGFSGCLTLELYNVGLVPIEIRPGMPICQLFLHTAKGVPCSHKVDTTQFQAQRKPMPSKIAPDEFVKALQRAYGPEAYH